MVDKTVVVRLNAVTGTYQAEMAAAAGATQAFSASVAQSTQQAGGSVSRFGKIASNVGKLTLLGVAAGLALSAKAAIEFESSFAGIRKTVDTSEAGFANLADQIRRLSTEIPISVNELNRIGELGGQLGVDVTGLPAFIETIAKVGVTTTLSVEDAALAFARLDNILQLGGDSFDRLGSVLVELGNNFAATENEITTFALRIAPIGATVGLTADEVLALATAFASVGVPAERGGTAIQKIFIRISEAAQNMGEDLDAFARIAGTTAEQFQNLVENDPSAAFQAFIEGIGRIRQEGGNVFAVLEDVDLQNQRVISSILAMASASDVLADALETGSDEWEVNIALTEEAEKRFETTASKIELAKNQINEMAISIGQNLLPILGDVADGIGDFLAGLDALPGPAKAFLGILLGIVAGAQIGTIAFSALAKVVGIEVTTAFAAAGRAAGLFRAAVGATLVGAIAIVIGEIVKFGQAQRDSQARVDNLVDAIAREREGMQGLTRDTIKQNLVSEGHEQLLNRLGITLDTFVDAILDEGDARERVTARIAILDQERIAGIRGIQEAGEAAFESDEQIAAKQDQLAREQEARTRDLTDAEDLLATQIGERIDAVDTEEMEFQLRLQAALIESGGKMAIVEANLAAAQALREGTSRDLRREIVLTQDSVDSVNEAVEDYATTVDEQMADIEQDLRDNIVSWDLWREDVEIDIGAVADAIFQRLTAERDFEALLQTAIFRPFDEATKNFLRTLPAEEKAAILTQFGLDPVQVLEDAAALQRALRATNEHIRNELIEELPRLIAEGTPNLFAELDKVVRAEVEADPTGTTTAVDAWAAVMQEAILGAEPELAAELLAIFTGQDASRIFAEMEGIGEAAGNGLINGLRNKFGAAQSAGSQLLERVTVGSQNQVQVESPSRVFMEIGNEIAAGLTMGIDQGFRQFTGLQLSAIGATRHQLGTQVTQVATSMETQNQFDLTINGSRDPGRDAQTALLGARLVAGL